MARVAICEKKVLADDIYGNVVALNGNRRHLVLMEYVQDWLSPGDL